jgi:hypothetical protein
MNQNIARNGVKYSDLPTLSISASMSSDAPRLLPTRFGRITPRERGCIQSCLLELRAIA